MADDWRTPPWLTEALGYFHLDPCSGPGSTVLAEHALSLENGDDGLTADWGHGSVFCNPPYSDPLPWARRLAAHEGPWVALVKLDPTTRWWDTLLAAASRALRTRRGSGGGPYRSWAPFKHRVRFYTPAGEPAVSVANFPAALVWKDWDLPAAMRPHLETRR